MKNLSIKILLTIATVTMLTGCYHRARTNPNNVKYFGKEAQKTVPEKEIAANPAVVKEEISPSSNVIDDSTKLEDVDTLSITLAAAIQLPMDPKGADGENILATSAIIAEGTLYKNIDEAYAAITKGATGVAIGYCALAIDPFSKSKELASGLKIEPDMSIAEIDGSSATFSFLSPRDIAVTEIKCHAKRVQNPTAEGADAPITAGELQSIFKDLAKIEYQIGD